jgi:hypothetical protein
MLPACMRKRGRAGTRAQLTGLVIPLGRPVELKSSVTDLEWFLLSFPKSKQGAASAGQDTANSCHSGRKVFMCGRLVHLTGTEPGQASHQTPTRGPSLKDSCQPVLYCSKSAHSHAFTVTGEREMPNALPP